jgi:CRP/FNR family transcriptional regulator, polysaccharide utilization system transcription regulator
MRQEQDSERITYLIESLSERRKELNCIYRVDDILRDWTVDLAHVFREIIMVLPEAWRYSEVCRACINYDGEVFEPIPFKRTKLKQSASIRVEDTVMGEIQIFYIKPITNDKGIFLPDEQKLLNTIAEKLSSFILLKRLKDAFQQQQKGDTNDSDRSAKLTILDYLQNLGLTEEERERMTRVKIAFRKGETIAKQGALNAYVMVLADGLAKAYLEGYQEKGLNFKIIQPFDFIGLTSIRESESYRFSVAAITPCTLYLVEKEVFMNLVKRNKDFSDFLMSWYCKFTGHIFTRLHCVANKQAPGRIADVLLYLSKEVFHGNIIPTTISRKDVAELAGMSTESAVRILSELKNDGIIRVLKEGLELLKPDLLKTISIAG